METKTIKPKLPYNLYVEDEDMGGVLSSCLSKCGEYTFAGEYANDIEKTKRNAVVSVICKASKKTIGNYF